jgi:hypothetical protein
MAKVKNNVEEANVVAEIPATETTAPETTSNIVDVEIIPFECTVDLKVSGDFIARLSTFLTNFFPYKDQDHFNQLIKDVKDKTNQEDPYVYHFTTLVALQAHIEEQAKAQKVTKMIKVDKTTGKPVDENGNPIEAENQPVLQDQEPTESQD